MSERLKYRRILKERMRIWLRDYKKGKKCNHCKQEFPPYVLDFHHLNPEEKTTRIQRLVAQTSTWKQLKEEVSKCELLCANCHREHHYGSGIKPPLYVFGIYDAE